MKALVVTLVLAVFAGDAAAQAFPVDAQWSPLFCRQAVMTDPFQDAPPATAERDLVGDLDAPAAMRATDADFLYLRLRLDQDPLPMPNMLAAFAWGFAIDLDADLRSYELLLVVDGTGGGQAVVAVLRNTMTATPNDPSDPAEMPVATFPITTHANKRTAAGSQFGGGNDTWLELAVPWATLAPLGFTPTTPIRVWAASSSMPDRLDGDFACHDARGGAPVLDVIVSDPTVGDPAVDTDGDGFTDAEEVAAGSDPNDPGSIPASRLEGGGGCSTGGGAGLVLGLLLLARRRRRG